MAATASLLSLRYKPSCSKTRFSNFTPPLSLSSNPKPCLRLSLRSHCAAVQEAASSPAPASSPAEEQEEEQGGQKRKIYVSNLPWSFKESEIQKLFEECGNVKDISVIKHENGRSRGYAFVTMETGEEALAAIQKFNSYDLLGRTLKVEFSKAFSRPPRPASAPSVSPRSDTFKVYVSNLAFKARSAHLRDFFAAHGATSARVVFENENKRSAGYGFVGFGSLGEAEKAVAELDGKELMDRPVRLKIRERVDKKPENPSKESQDGTTISENPSEETQENAANSENSSEEIQES